MYLQNKVKCCSQHFHFMPPFRKIGGGGGGGGGGILFYRPSICLSVYTNLTRKLNIFQFSYKAHIWYEGTSHCYTSPGTKVKVKYRGHVSQKMGV